MRKRLLAAVLGLVGFIGGASGSWAIYFEACAYISTPAGCLQDVYCDLYNEGGDWIGSYHVHYQC